LSPIGIFLHDPNQALTSFAHPSVNIAAGGGLAPGIQPAGGFDRPTEAVSLNKNTDRRLLEASHRQCWRVVHKAEYRRKSRHCRDL